MRRSLLVLLAGLLPAFSSEREQKFAFALPEAEGRISLGVFDSAGKLRRTLYVAAEENDFTVGLNGLIASWDGKDDRGQPLPAGQYQVRGYLVPDEVEAEGVAYHFNDWVDDESAPRITRIDDFRKQAGSFILLAETLQTGRPAVFRYDQLRGFLWTSHPESVAPPGDEANAPAGPQYPPPDFAEAGRLFSPVKSHLLATTDRYAAVLLGGSVSVLDMNDGVVIAKEGERFPQAVSVDASDDILYVGSATGVSKVPLPGLDPVSELEAPLGFDALAAHGGHLLGANSGRWEVWESTGTTWSKLPLTVAASSLSFGREETLWMTAIDEKDSQPFTGQFDKQGEFLRSYRDEFLPVRVCASTVVEEIAVLERTSTVQRLRVLSLGQGTSDAAPEWVVDFERVIQDCRRFGVVGGELVPDAGDVPQSDRVNVTLATGGLTTSPHKLGLRVVSDQRGLWLQTESGLRLAFLADQSSVRRVVVLFAPEKEFLTVYAGDGAVVAEYAVKGLRTMVEIDAGEIELQ